MRKRGFENSAPAKLMKLNYNKPDMFNYFAAYFFAFVEDNVTMSSIRWFENYASYFVQNRRKQTLLNSSFYNK